MPTSRGNPDDIVRALADPERVAIAGVLARADRTADELAEDLGVETRRVMAQLGPMAASCQAGGQGVLFKIQGNEREVAGEIDG